MIGLYPLVQNTAFDMASDGDTYRLYIPIKNRFIVGKGQQTEEHRSASALDNLRPQHILDALLLRGPQSGKEEAVLEVSSESGNFYIIHVLRSIPGRSPLLARNIWLERRDLSVVRLQMFDDNGEEVTDVLYSDYVMSSGIPYPREILVERPKDLYSLRLLISTLALNQPIDDEKFRLEQPPGTELTNLDQQPAPKNGGNGG
jgi:outer membrane lipoprotein-sorting protein